jgi:hypothetical protein
MASRRVSRIIISNRTVQIGDNVFALATISRVQALRVVPDGGSATGHKITAIIRDLLLIILFLAALAFFGPPVVRAIVDPTEPPSQATVTTIAIAVVVLLAVGVAAGRTAISVACDVVVLAFRVLRMPRYALVIEAAGTQCVALTGTDRDEIRRSAHEIVSAIGDMSGQDKVINIHGAQAVQIGDRNTQSNRYEPLSN